MPTWQRSLNTASCCVIVNWFDLLAARQENQAFILLSIFGRVLYTGFFYPCGPSPWREIAMLEGSSVIIPSAYLGLQSRNGGEA